jgi:hypothetical protein
VKPETVRGVGTYYVNLILDIVFGVFALIVSVSAIYIAATSDPFTAIAITAALGAATCGLIIVFVINFILSLMSVLRMHHGADEYGPDHAANARRGVLFKWIGTTLSTMAAILVAYLLLVGATAFSGFGSSPPPIVFVPLLVTAFWTAGVTAKAQMYRFMVRSLQPPETRRWSDVASAIIPGLGIVGVFVVAFFTVRVITLITNPGSVTSAQEASRLTQLMIGGVFLPPGLAVVGYLVFLMVYGRTRDRLSQGVQQIYGAVPPPMAWNMYLPVPFAATPPAGAVSTLGPTAPGLCTRCGTPLPAAAMFCPNCGNPSRA